MTITYNALDQRYQNNDQRYSDWVAQGRPVKDSMGRDLDVRGQVVGNANEIYNYTSQNYADYDRIYGQGAAALEMYNHRDRSRVNPFDQALQPNTPRPSPIAQPVMGNQPSPVQLPAGNRGPIQQPRMMTNKTPITNQTPMTGPAGDYGAKDGPTPNQISVDPTTGRLMLNGQVLDRRDPRLYGTAGYLGGSNEMTIRNGDSINRDYWNLGTSYNDDSGTGFSNYTLNPEVVRRLGGRVQLSQSGTGGWDEVIDPSQLIYDPEFGVLADRSNIREDDPAGARRARLIRDGILAFGAAAAGGFIPGSEGGITGALAGTPEIITGTGMLPESVAPQVTGTLAGTPAINGVAGAGAAAAGTGAGSTVANTISQYGRYVTPIVSALTNGGGNGGGTSRPTGGGGTGTSGIPSIADFITQLITGGVGNYQANRNIGQFTDLINDMLTRGDPYAGERASAIQRLRTLESNPGSIVSNPLFRNMNDQSQMDLQRRMSARGMSLSGNELGDLQNNFLANMNRFYGDEWNRTAREAGVFFDPSAIASAGMRAGGEVFSGRQNRDAGLQALIAAANRRGGGQGGSGGGNTIADLINGIFGGNSEGNSSDTESGMSDEDWNSWWDSWIEGNYGGDNPIGDAGGYNG